MVFIDFVESPLVVALYEGLVCSIEAGLAWICLQTVDFDDIVIG